MRGEGEEVLFFANCVKKKEEEPPPATHPKGEIKKDTYLHS